VLEAMNVFAIVLAIVGTGLSLIPHIGGFAILLTLLAVFFGAMSVRRKAGREMAIVGLVLGTIGSLIAGSQIDRWHSHRGHGESKDVTARLSVEKYVNEAYSVVVGKSRQVSLESF
jgi:EamA domain-containing membrane protein RarD